MQTCSSCIYKETHVQAGSGVLARCCKRKIDGTVKHDLIGLIRRELRLQPERVKVAGLWTENDYLYHHWAEINGRQVVDEVWAAAQEWLDAQPKSENRPRMTNKLKGWVLGRRIKPRPRPYTIHPMGLTTITMVAMNRVGSDCADYKLRPEFKKDFGCHRGDWIPKVHPCESCEDKICGRFQDSFIPEGDSFWLYPIEQGA